MSDEVKLLPCDQTPELLPCPFCRQELEVVESWAKAFDPPRLYREYHHRASGCVLGRLDWTFPDLAEENRQAFIAAWNTRAIEATRPTDEGMIKHMVNRFLMWKLPENFHPDAGISFKPTFNDHMNPPMRHNPIGTNLLDAMQAEEMVRFMLGGVDHD